MSKIAGGKIFYSNDENYLKGIQRGAEYVNDGPIVVHEIESSDKAGYTYMLALEDSDVDEVDIETDG